MTGKRRRRQRWEKYDSKDLFTDPGGTEAMFQTRAITLKIRQGEKIQIYK